MTKKCKSCQTEIDAKAKKCPHCQADQRGWFRRHPILTGLFVIIIVFIVIGAASGGSSKSSSSGSSTTASTQPQTQSGKVGQTVTDGDLAFTVQSVDTAHTLGNSLSPQTAQGEYYILTVKIQNNGKSTDTIDSSDFTVIDSQGRTYNYSTDGQTAMEEADGATSFFLQQIQPSLSVTGKIVFDVPATATGLKLLAQGDLFSTPVAIDLRK